LIDGLFDCLIDVTDSIRNLTNLITMVACNGSDDLGLGGQRELGEPRICGVSGLIIEVVSVCDIDR